MAQSSNINQSPPESPPEQRPEIPPEPRQRSVGELKQLLGFINIADLTTGETPTAKANAFLEVHASTEDRLNWKPEFYAESKSEKGTLRVIVTRAESDALIAAGATGTR